MLGIIARLGQVVFALGVLLAALIVLAGFGIVGWGLWTDARILLAAVEGGNWNQIGMFALRVAEVVGGAVGFALIPLLIGAACCYVLGGFTHRANSN